MNALLDFYFAEIEGGLREFEFQVFEGFDDDARDGEIAEPFVVRGNDEPGGVLGAAAAKDVFVGARVFVPVGALLKIGWRGFPIAFGVFDAGLEAFFLFVFADVQKKISG